MSGKGLLPVEDALARILDRAPALPAERVSIARAHGRVLAEDAIARVTNPPWDVSAMDGYAVRAEDVADAPVTLEIVAETPAGALPAAAIAPGEAVRIFTGAPLPPGADTVIIQENTERDGNIVRILQAEKPGKNVRVAGLDFCAGDIVIPRGTRIHPRAIGLLAAANLGELRVARRPRVAILASGNELHAPGTTGAPGQIPSSNSLALAALVEEEGGLAMDLGIALDDPADISARIGNLQDYDLLLTSGGASVGDHDHMQGALKSLGVEIDFWKIAMRPGKPLMFGHRDQSLVLGLPGNPVSGLICAEVFLRPLLRHMQGLCSPSTPTLARLTTALRANETRQNYLRATIRMGADGCLEATPFPLQDSAMQTPLVAADGLIIRPPHAPAAEPGALVPVLLFSGKIT